MKNSNMLTEIFVLESIAYACSSIRIILYRRSTPEPPYSSGIVVQSDIVANYVNNFGNEEQKQKWLPKMATGEVVTAIAHRIRLFFNKNHTV
jgi:alkylation response protein AidB-like acyl-CoA dehydrogenase